MQFSALKVGDPVGVRSENPNVLRFYRYERAHVLELSDEAFRLPWGWFSKTDGRKGFNVVVTLAELEENNAEFFREQQASRYRTEIEKCLAVLSSSLEDVAMLARLVQVLQSGA